MPNPIQIQLGTFFWDYDNGWAFPCNLLEKRPQIGAKPFPIHGEPSLFTGYVYLLT
jgi:hypothetical protein